MPKFLKQPSSQPFDQPRALCFHHCHHPTPLAATSEKMQKRPKRQKPDPAMTLLRPSITSDAKTFLTQPSSQPFDQPRALCFHHCHHRTLLAATSAKTQKRPKFQKPDPGMKKRKNVQNSKNQTLR
jgi:hypothetical protein